MKYAKLAVIILLAGCADNEMAPSSGNLEGKWIEKVNKRDTLIFDPELNGNESRYFIFKCSKGISGYTNVYSTMFEYELNGGRMSLYNTVSSCYCFSDYSFKQRDDKIFIENFYDSNSDGKIETFEKLN